MTIHPQSAVFSASTCRESHQDPKKYLQPDCSWSVTEALHRPNSVHPAACFYHKQGQLKCDEHGWGSECLHYHNCSQQQTLREVGSHFPNTLSWPLSFTSLINPHQLNRPSQEPESCFPKNDETTNYREVPNSLTQLLCQPFRGEVLRLVRSINTQTFFFFLI